MVAVVVGFVGALGAVAAFVGDAATAEEVGWEELPHALNARQIAISDIAHV